MKRILNFINRNGILSSLIAAAIFALIVFFINRDKRILTYKIITHEKLFDKEDNTSFLLFTKDSIRINQNVYFLEIDIWNQGDLAILEQDIRDPFVLKLDKGAAIVTNPKIIETHPNVTNSIIKLDSIKNSTQLQFDFLEKGNGIKIIQYYSYKNSEPSNVKHNGYISGNSEIRYFNETFTHKYNNWLILVALILSVFLIIPASSWLSRFIDRQIEKYGSGIKQKYIKLILWLIIYMPIAWFTIVKVLGKIPRWIYEFLAEYFNRDTPF